MDAAIPMDDLDSEDAADAEQHAAALMRARGDTDRMAEVLAGIPSHLLRAVLATIEGHR